MTGTLLSATPRQVYSLRPWVHYISVHMVSTAFIALFPKVREVDVGRPVGMLIDAYGYRSSILYS